MAKLSLTSARIRFCLFPLCNVSSRCHCPFNASYQQVSLLEVPNNSTCLIIQHIKTVFSAGSHWAFSLRWRLWHLLKWNCTLLEWIPRSFLSGFGANRIINWSWFVFYMAKELQWSLKMVGSSKAPWQLELLFIPLTSFDQRPDTALHPVGFCAGMWQTREQIIWV